MFFVAPTWTALALCGILYFIRMFGITAGYHRYFAHRSYKTSRAFQFVLALLGCSALQKGPLWWAAHHRGHHRYSDTENDPHSPIIRGFWWSHVGWLLTSKYDDTNLRLVRDWQRYPELCWLNRLHWLPGLTLATICWAIDGWTGVLWGFVFSTILTYHSTFAVNSICHILGSRRYPTTDASRNNWWVALLTLGEGWHNNHHHHQCSARQGFYWWEVDISYYVIRTLGAVGLVWDIRQPAAHVLAKTEPSKTTAESTQVTSPTLPTQPTEPVVICERIEVSSMPAAAENPPATIPVPDPVPVAYEQTF